MLKLTVPVPLRVPALTLVTVQVFATLSPIAVLLPKPPSIVATVPPLNAKLSASLPPTRFWKLLKVKIPSISPLLGELIFQLLALFSPVKVLLNAELPFATSMLAILPLTPVAVLVSKFIDTSLP